MHKLSNNIFLVVLKLFFSTALAVFAFTIVSIFGFTNKAEAAPTCTNGLSNSAYGVYGAAQFSPSTVTMAPDGSANIILDSIICNASDHLVDDTNFFNSKGYVNGKEALTITGGTASGGFFTGYRQKNIQVAAHSSQHLYFSATLKGTAPDGTPIFSGSGYYTIYINGFGYVYDMVTGTGSYTNVVNTPFGINIVLSKGHIQITKYGPNGQGNFSEPRFNLCVQGNNGICTGAGGHSNNVAVDPGQYYVLKTNNNYPPGGSDPPPDGWYIDHAQLGTPGSNVAADVFGRFPYTVTSNGQTWADIYLQKYAATCGTSNIFSFNGSTTTPKAGEKFAMNFGMNNPSGITNWTWPTSKLHVKVPKGVTPINSLNGQAVGSFDWQSATRDLYIAPPSYGTIYSGQSVNYTAFFQYDAGSTPGNYAYQYNMVFPSNSTAWIKYTTGDTTYIPNCNGTSPLVRPTFYPWLQTKNGDVLARGTVIGQEFSKPGSRSDTSFGSELDYLLLSPGQNSSPAAKQFCSLNRYVLGRDMSKQCSAGLYDFTQQDFEDIQKAVSKTWERNGAGAGGSCIPYKTSTGNLPSGNISPGCAGGTMYKKIGNTNLSSFVSGSGAQSVSLGRATVWVTGKLTIDRDIINSYSSVTAGGSAPNLAFFVEGDVEIAPGVSQVDAIIISFPGRIKTCSQYPNPSCQSKLIANGYWAASLGFQFGRNYFDTTNPNANPAEQVILTGQSVVFPPPGLSRSDGDIESQLKYFDGELPPRLN